MSVHQDLSWDRQVSLILYLTDALLHQQVKVHLYAETQLLVSVNSLGIKDAILNNAISNPPERLGASSISRFAINPI